MRFYRENNVLIEMTFPWAKLSLFDTRSRNRFFQASKAVQNHVRIGRAVLFPQQQASARSVLAARRVTT